MRSSAPRPLSGSNIRSGAWPGMRCREVVYDPDAYLPPHEHELPFFGLSLHGGYEERTGGAEYTYGPGTAVYHGSGEEHSVRIGREPVRCFVVELDCEEIGQRFDCGLPSGPSSPRLDGEVPAILTAMYREFRLADSSAALSLQGLLLQLIAAVSRDDATVHGRPPFLDRLEDYLRTNFRSQLTLDEVAAAVGAPAVRVSAAFRAFHGSSIAVEQRRLRIEHACQCMLDGSRSLAAIALECGFADQPHFSRAFRRVKGVTPARYRSMMR